MIEFQKILNKPSKDALLIIAGSDSSSGAGISADLQICFSENIHPLLVITAVTAQDNEGVKAIMPVSIEVIKAQIITNLENKNHDIKAIKTGMLYNVQIADLIYEILSKKEYKNIPLIVDPVLAASSGGDLNDRKPLDIFKNLYKRINLITPNILEAEKLTGVNIKNIEDIKQAASIFFEKGVKSVYIKGGHFKKDKDNNLTDFYFKSKNQAPEIIKHKYISGCNFRGTGCRLASLLSLYSCRVEM